MKAIVAGATGLVGSELVKKLLEDNTFKQIVVYARKTPQIEDSRLTVVLGELSEINAHRDVLKGDVYFCCLGTTIKTAGSQENFRKVDFHGVVSFGRLAFTHKASKFLVISANGAHSQSRIFYNRVKGETEKALKDIGFPSLVVYRPGLLVGNREEKRTTEKLAVKSYRILRHILPEKLTRSVATEVTSLVNRMIADAKSPAPGVQIIESRDI